MKLLIYGHNGWIGNQIIDYLEKETNIKFIKGKTRVNNIEELKKEILEINPTHILSLIGRTHGIYKTINYKTIDYLELPGKLVDNIRDNLYSPVILAILCNELKIHLTYLGTGCIFSYDKNHTLEDINNKGFNEEDKPNFFGSSYSIVKGYTDQLMQLFKKNVLNLRIRMPISDYEHDRNFITKIIKYDKICSIPNSMTVLPDIIPIIIDMIKKNIDGTFNMVNPNAISHNEILTLYKEIVDKNFTWKNFSIEEQNEILLSKRSNNYLDTDKLCNLYPNIPPIEISIKKCLEKYKLSIDIKENNSIENSNILITGGYGFIGSHCINYLFMKYKKINIINVDAMYYCANEENVDIKIRNSNRYKFYKGNIGSRDLIDKILKENNINIVIHLAAQSHVNNSFNESLKYTYDNVLGTHTLLECSRLYNKLDKFIHVSTDEVYGESSIDDINFKTENSILNPTNPYAGTKAAAELIAKSYYYSFKFPLIITRSNNIFGINQYPEKVIPKFIQQLNNNKKITIQGDGSAKRGFLYITDLIDGFDKILNYGQIGEIYNIGCNSDMEFKIIDIAKILIKLIKNTENYDEWIEYIEDRPFNDVRYFINNDKLKKLNWNIKVGLIDGLNKIINK